MKANQVVTAPSLFQEPQLRFRAKMLMIFSNLKPEFIEFRGEVNLGSS